MLGGVILKRKHRISSILGSVAPVPKTDSKIYLGNKINSSSMAIPKTMKRPGGEGCGCGKATKIVNEN